MTAVTILSQIITSARRRHAAARTGDDVNFVGRLVDRAEGLRAQYRLARRVRISRGRSARRAIYMTTNAPAARTAMRRRGWK